MDNKKNILFVLNCMGAGGIAKSLVNLLTQMEKYKDEYDIDLLLFGKWGVHLDAVPQYVNVIEAHKAMRIFAFSQRDCKQFGMKLYLKRFFTAVWTKIFTNKLPLKVAIQQAKLSKHYDLAVAFAHTQDAHKMACGSPEFVLYGVDASKKCMVCHGDVVIEKLLCKQNVKNYKKFDKLYSVSKSCAEQLSAYCTELANISDYLYNTQLNEEIVKKSTEFDVKYDKSKLNFVTVARLSPEKGLIRTINAVNKLRNEGFDFYWHICGDGVLKQEMQQQIKEYNLEDRIILHGYQQNPYPFMKSADVLYLGSYHEAAPMVFAESMILQTPILSTNTRSANELVGEKGWVCENSEQGIYEGLKYILNNQQEIAEKKQNLKDFTYDNDAIVKKLLSLIEN